jgi:hypothetical protein
MTTFEYRDSTVALIDILGFTRAVRLLKDDKSGEAQKKVAAGIKVLKDVEDQLKTDFYKKFINPEGDLRVTMFSDTIVCTSASANSLRVIFQAHMIGCELMAKGFLCRGGISGGLSFHQNNIFFGDAVIDAYYMESELASYPRILVCNDIAKEFHQARKSLPNGFSDNFLRQDVDGLWYVNVFDGPTGYLLANKSKDWPQTEVAEFWVSAGRCIQTGLQENGGNVSVTAKYSWAASKYNDQAPDNFPRI